MTPDRYEDIAYELNRELAQDELREIDRRVEHARTASEGDAVTTTDRLTEIEARLSAATPGPWVFAYSTIHASSKFGAWEELDIPEPHTAERRGKCEGCPDRRQGCCYWRQFEDLDPAVAYVAASYGDTATGQRVKDADLIAHAPTDLAALVAVVREVQKIHRPEWASDHHGGGYYRCQADGWTLDEATPSCPTAAAVQKLGGGS